MNPIDGDALKASLKESADRCREWIKDCADQEDYVMQRIAEQTLLTFNECAMRIDGMPSVQPDIIVCADCNHWICHDRRCGFWNHGVRPLDWCCHAERRIE